MIPEQTLNLTGKVALVSGAGVGIGRAVALALGQAGAFVGIHYHSSKSGAEQLHDELISKGISCMLLPADLTQENGANNIVDKLVSETNRLDILVNNGGGLIKRAKIEDCTLENWNKSLDLNLTSAFLLTKRAIPHLRTTGSGRIINILSLSVQTGGANGGGSYAAAKGGLMVFTHTLAKELAPLVRTNSVMPGTVETQHHERCRTAINDIVAFTLEKCLANDIQVPGTKDDIVKLAFQQGWVTSAADRPESEGP